MNIAVLDVDGSKHVSVQQLLLLRLSSWLSHKVCLSMSQLVATK